MIGQYLPLSCLPAGGLSKLPLLLHKLPLHHVLLVQCTLFAFFLLSSRDWISNYPFHVDYWSSSKSRKQTKIYVKFLGKAAALGSAIVSLGICATATILTRLAAQARILIRVCMLQRPNIPPLVRKPCAACLQSLSALLVEADSDANFDSFSLLWSTPPTCYH